MILRVDAAADVVEIDDPRNFRAFTVRLVGRFADPERRAALIARFADADNGAHAWVREQALRDWPEFSGEPWWREGLDGLIVLARQSGFYDDARHTIRAHIEIAERQ